MKLGRSARIGATVWLLSVVLVAVVTLPGRLTRAGDGGEQVFAWSGASAGLEAVELRAQSGEIEVLASPDDTISVLVSVRPNPKRPRSILSRPNPANLSHARLGSTRRDRALRLEIEKASSGRRIERWSVQVPARLAARVWIGNGEVTIRGIEGGVEARANAGMDSRPGLIEVDVPGGSVEAVLSVGTVSVQSATKSYGDVQVRSNVGDADLWIEGHRVVHGDPPGPGSQVALDGEGRDRIVARVSVGDAKVRVR